MKTYICARCEKEFCKLTVEDVSGIEPTTCPWGIFRPYWREEEDEEQETHDHEKK